MWELWPVIHVGFEEAVLLLGGWVAARVARPWDDRIMVVICPLCKMVGKLQAREVGC